MPTYSSLSIKILVTSKRNSKKVTAMLMKIWTKFKKEKSKRIFMSI